MSSMPRAAGLPRSAWRFAAVGAVIVGALLSPAAQASDICQAGDPANAGLGLAEVKPSKGIDLRKTEAPCPDDSGLCKSSLHLKKNELVLTTSRISGPYVCVYVAGSSMDVGGYVKQTDIAPRPPLPLKAWKGKWREAFGNWIKLRVEGDALGAEGEAFYPSAHPSKEEAPGGPNTGDMPPGPAAPHNNVAVFAYPDDHGPDSCRVIVALDNAAVVVSDNVADGGICGGANVRFSGDYYK
ncbi:hypothetical protein [Mesorhizobium humile]|uniref:Secreted protein n=1 Tax=Mesorhizobium humile TaxID=3072313 RepID=A0ABU4Y9S3_9HYPH|nr:MULTISPECIES: hypothetical protein [unclassified Mesorhizobium]MDX8458266.1 hypothetical protein [Mesorhizobium sp. VK2D]MDX8483679.1 hypothetical protein [Mesorhizobium sp. VK2B]